MTKRFKTGYKIGVIILAIITSMLLGAVILLAIGADVFKTYLVILTEPLKNKIGVTEVSSSPNPSYYYCARYYSCLSQWNHKYSVLKDRWLWESWLLLLLLYYSQTPSSLRINSFCNPCWSYRRLRFGDSSLDSSKQS